ncbi:MAG: hypothetical protein R3F12_12935 [Lysobacteraceae bacterium]
MSAYLSLAQGVLPLVGVIVGAGLTYWATKRLNEQQREAAKKERISNQLERLNKILDEIEREYLSRLSIAQRLVGISAGELKVGERISVAELEFLAHVYVPSSRLFCAEIRSKVESSNQCWDEFVEKGFNVRCLLPLTHESEKLKSEFSDSVQHLRDEAVNAMFVLNVA